mgnify:CR=1 FL=1
MKNAPDRKAAESARNSANYTASAPRPDIAQAVKDIRLACDTIARLAALDTLSEKGVKQ